MCHSAQTKGAARAKVPVHVKLLHKGNAMLYRFKSGAASDLIMNGNRGDQLLDIIGKPPAPRGILPVDALADAIRALELAVSTQEAQSRAPNHDNEVTLRQRAWPLVEMLKRAHHEQVAVVWGV